MPIRGVEAEWPQIRSVKGRWGFRIALLSLATLLVAGVEFRNRAITLQEMTAALGVGTTLGVFGFGLSLMALVDLWRRGGRGSRFALGGIMLGALAAGPAVLAAILSATLPPINDITTSPNAPPALSAVANERQAAGAAVDYPGAAVAALQAEAYPRIVPLTVPQAPEMVFDTALALAKEWGWRVVFSEMLGRDPGQIVAVSSTMFLNFEDDVALRITRARQQGARVDMRSASRLGRHDFGTNARRIMDFLAALEYRLNNPPN